jgi:hypothetical protein
MINFALSAVFIETKVIGSNIYISYYTSGKIRK